MALTTGLSCVDYLSFKFGCQSLNSEKEIYNHLSQEWFYGSLIEEFHLDAKQNSWGSIFTDVKLSNQRNLENGKGLRNIIQKKHKARGYRKKYFSECCRALEEQPSPVTFSLGEGNLNRKESNEGKTEKLLETENEDNGRKLGLFIDANKRDEIKSDEDDYHSESELELLQICDSMNEENSRFLSEICKSSRKRSSNDSLNGEINFAKRMRPSIDLAKMHSSRFSQDLGVEEESGRFIPIHITTSL